MSLKKYPEFHSFLISCFSESEPEKDTKSVQAFVSRASSEKQAQVLVEAQTYLAADTEGLIEDFGMEINRWFGDAEEGRTWVQSILALFHEASVSENRVVKDSNGTVLSEGDSVTVIKDLKVKGGSSDLKRGTLIKKIRLIGDLENIECNVEGSTLVLKTCFLKKS